jgi:hypothetical protein
MGLIKGPVGSHCPVGDACVLFCRRVHIVQGKNCVAASRWSNKRMVMLKAVPLVVVVWDLLRQLVMVCSA